MGSRARLSKVWWTVLAVVAGASVLLQFLLIFTTDVPPPDGASLPVQVVRFFSYFTIQSNLLVLAATVPLIRDPAHDGPLWRVLRLDALLGITITGIVFVIMLADQYRPVGVAWWTNLGMHYVSPVLTVGGWLVLGPWGRIDRGVVLKGLIWIGLWIVWTLGIGAATRWYPYDFLNVAQLGYGATLRNIAVINLGGLAFLSAFYGVDRVRAGAGLRREELRAGE